MTDNTSPTPPKSDPYPETFRQGVFMGFALGVFLGIWYAPQSGEQTLKRTSDWLEKSWDNLTGWADRTRDTANQAVERSVGRIGSEPIEDALAEGRAAAHRHRAAQAAQSNPPRTLPKQH